MRLGLFGFTVDLMTEPEHVEVTEDDVTRFSESEDETPLDHVGEPVDYDLGEDED